MVFCAIIRAHFKSCGCNEWFTMNSSLKYRVLVFSGLLIPSFIGLTQGISNQAPMRVRFDAIFDSKITEVQTKIPTLFLFIFFQSIDSFNMTEHPAALRKIECMDKCKKNQNCAGFTYKVRKRCTLRYYNENLHLGGSCLQSGLL